MQKSDRSLQYILKSHGKKKQPGPVDLVVEGQDRDGFVTLYLRPSVSHALCMGQKSIDLPEKPKVSIDI